MEIMLKQIDEYNDRLQKDILHIVEDQSIPLTEKNRLMEPIADQKKILIYTKESLLKIKNKKYEAKCGMSEVNNK
jgi:hypothetical protein